MTHFLEKVKYFRNIATQQKPKGGAGGSPTTDACDLYVRGIIITVQTVTFEKEIHFC